MQSPFVWGVKFHSTMCGSCKEVIPAWNDLRESVPGVHWGEVNIDRKENLALAKRLNVLKEGIPNIKLFRLDSQPLPILTGTSLSETAHEGTLTEMVKAALKLKPAGKDTGGFYKSEL